MATADAPQGTPGGERSWRSHARDPSRRAPLRLAIAVLLLVGAAPLITYLFDDDLVPTSGLLFGGGRVASRVELRDALPLRWAAKAGAIFGAACLLAAVGMWRRRRWAWQLAQGLALAALVSCLFRLVMAGYAEFMFVGTPRGGLLASLALLIDFASWACGPVLLSYLLGSAPVAAAFPTYVRPIRDAFL